MSDTSPENGWGPLSFPEAASNLSLASRQLRVRGHCGRLIRQDQSRLSFPKHCGERQGAPDWSTLTGNARHPSYRRGAFAMRPDQMVLSARPGRCAGSGFSDDLVATRQGEGALKLAPRE